MTYGSIATSLWVWAAAAFLGAGLGVLVWSLLRMASITSRDEERMDAEMEAQARERWLEMKAKYEQREAEWRKYHGKKEA